MQSPDPNKLIKIGQLKKPYGIKGWLWIFSETDDRMAIFSMQPWWIKTAVGFKPLTIRQWRQQGSGLVAQFSEINNRTLAETMQGVSIWTDKNNLPKLDDDEYYWSDLIGLLVYNNEQQYFGKVKELFETGAHAIMVIEPMIDSIDNKQRLIPWHQQTVLSINLEARSIIVDWQIDY